jgi:tRNA A-37 threonylcarbamoyl transferase component Bud32
VSRTQSRDTAPPDLPGYRFIRHLGAGGNAQVYLYEQDLPHREVAVKVLNESALSEAARRRFTAEANVTAGLAHRHIVQVFDAKVTDDGRPYIVMPYYPQPNLSVRARRAHFSVAEVLRIGVQIGSAVETSHRHDVLHRDIKPQNILIDSYGEPALTDFGIATTKGGDGPEGLSVPWSPPEILYGTAPGDQRSDVYSLGATLWHLFVGHSPFEVPGGDNTPYALMGRIKSESVPRTGRADVPDSLERLLRQTMAKDPAARPQTAMELIRGLQSIEQEMRLPLTQPVLPADGPQGGEAGGDTITRMPARSGETTFSRGYGPGPGGARLPGGAGEHTWRPGAGHADPPAHGGLSFQPGPGQTVQPGRGNTGQPPLGADSRDTTTARGGGATGSWGPAAGPWPADDNDNVTRKRGPVRLDPRGPAASAEEQATRARGPVTLDPWGGAPDPGKIRARQFPPEASESATLARPRRVAPGGADPFGTTDAGSLGRTGSHSRTEAADPFGAADPDQRKSGRGRVLAFVGGGAALAVVAGVAVIVLSHGGGQPGNAPTGAGQATQPGGAEDAIGPDATAPGQPAVTATRLSATQVKFSWTYDNPVSSDTFEWKRVSGTAGKPSGEATKPELIVTVPGGQSACFEVRVTRTDGQASDESQPACWPQ